MGAASLLVFAVVGCGYQPVYGRAGGMHLHVKLVRSLVVDAIASDEVAAGVREEFARAGCLEAGEGFPRAELEVLRSDAESEGIAARGGPVARATNVALVARAWVVASKGAPAAADTGDFRAEETVSLDVVGTAPDPRAAAFHDADALRSAARRLGRKLALKLLGAPPATEEDVDPR